MITWERIKIALDFDETYTLNAEMWKSIVGVMKSFNCDVRFVTYRYASAPGNEDIWAAADELEIPTIFCNYFQKAQVTASLGWIPDIWIDDMPILIPMKQQLQGMIIGIERSDEKRSQEEIKRD